jgi:hypothetical protein
LSGLSTEVCCGDYERQLNPRPKVARLEKPASGNAVSGEGQLLFGQALVNGIKSKLQAVGDSQLVDDIMQTRIDRHLGNEKFFPDLFIPVTLRHQSHDRSFGIAQQPLILAGPVFRALSESFYRNILLASSLTTPEPIKSFGNNSSTSG